MIINKDIYSCKILNEKFTYPGLEEYNGGSKKKKIDKEIIPTEKREEVKRETREKLDKTPRNKKYDWQKNDRDGKIKGRDIAPKKDSRKKEQIQKIDAKVDISSFNSIDLNNPKIKPLLDILDIIAEAELGHDASNYNAIYIRGSATRKINERYINQGKLFTDMTLTEIEQVQTEFLRMQKGAGKSGAIGRYQVVRREIRNFLSQGINPNTIFSPATQDKLALLLMRDAGVGIGRSTGKVNRIAGKWIGLKSKPSLKRRISEKLKEFDTLNGY